MAKHPSRNGGDPHANGLALTSIKSPSGPPPPKWRPYLGQYPKLTTNPAIQALPQRGPNPRHRTLPESDERLTYRTHHLDP